MIFCEPRDALTTALIREKVVPGMDQLTWVETDTEEDVRTDLRQATNRAMMQGASDVAVAPWPLPVPRQAPVDYTPRYEGLLFRLHEYDAAFEKWMPVPGGTAVLEQAGDVLDRDYQNFSRMLNPDEVRAAAARPADWVRLPFVNETGGTVLKEPAWLRWQGLQGRRFTLELPDNDLFQPFDLTHAERYAFLVDDETQIEHGDDWAGFGDRARLTLPLRARRLKWIVVVICHFEFITWFEEVPNDEVFISVFYLRPPFYPYRHDFAYTTTPEAYELQNFYGEPRSFDQGLASSWDLSWHSRELRQQILDQQWYSACEIYVFLGNEDPDLALQACPPRIGEVVCGLGFLDEASGRESRIWAMQKVDATYMYPLRTVGQFLLAGWQA